MGKTITNYSFNASAKTITFSDYSAIAIERILAVKNITTNAWIYKATDTSSYGGAVATNVLTFTASNAGMNNTDKLFIQYDDLTKQKPYLGTNNSMTVTNLNSLANSATAGWQSAKVDNTSNLATDVEINIKLTMANTAPANDKAAYVFICPFYYDGSAWFAASQGTTTLPTGSEGTTTIASPHNLRLLGVLNYTTQNMVLQDTFLLSNCFGNRLPDGFSIIIINFTGAALSGSGNVVQYKLINDTLI